MKLLLKNNHCTAAPNKQELLLKNFMTVKTPWILSGLAFISVASSVAPEKLLAFFQNLLNLAACKGLAAQKKHLIPELQVGNKGKDKDKLGNGNRNEKMDE